jgi:nitrite reductase/ring-hydroxylating ferredoxin subunit
MSNVLPAGTEFAQLAQIADGATRGITLGEGEWPLRGFLVRIGDTVHAYLNRCPHAGRQLNFLPDRFLTPDGELIQCLAHGALFDKASGLCVAGPCVDESLTRLPVEVSGGVVRLAQDLDLDQLERGRW